MVKHELHRYPQIRDLHLKMMKFVDRLCTILYVQAGHPWRQSRELYTSGPDVVTEETQMDRWQVALEHLE